MVLVDLLVVNRKSECQMPRLLLLWGHPFEPTGNSVLRRERIGRVAHNWSNLIVSSRHIKLLLHYFLHSLLLAIWWGLRIARNCEFISGSRVVQERSRTDLDDRSRKLSVESGVDIQIVTSENESQLCWNAMSHLEFHSLEFAGSVFDKTHSQLLLAAVTEMNECPHAFDVIVRNWLEHVRILSLVVMCDEVVAALTLPDCEGSISLFDISVRIVSCQTGNEVPRSILSIQERNWVAGHEPQPETVTVLTHILQILLGDLGVSYSTLIESSINNLIRSHYTLWFGFGLINWRLWWNWRRRNGLRRIGSSWSFGVSWEFIVISSVAKQHSYVGNSSVIGGVELVLGEGKDELSSQEMVDI